MAAQYDSQALVALVVLNKLVEADCICQAMLMAAAKHAKRYHFESLVRQQHKAV